MRIKEICRVLSYFLFIFSGILFIPFLLSIYYDFFVEDMVHPYPSSFFAFFVTILITLGIAVLFYLIGLKSKRRFYRKESLLMVLFIWVFISLLGAIPFYVTKTIDRPLDAIFEAVSGFTTTGSSIILPKKYDPDTGEEVTYSKKLQGAGHNTFEFKGTIKEFTDPYTGNTLIGFDAISRPLLFWRAFIQWLGGIGVAFVFIAIFPTLSLGGKFIYEAESHPALGETSTQEKLRPRVKEVASYLWKIYVVITVLQIILLLLTNSEVSVLDAVNISFATISTGGFSNHLASIGYYKAPVTQWIIIVFMLLGATNFALYFYIIKGKFKKLLTPELLLFWCFVILSCGLVVWKLYDGKSFSDTLLKGAFQTVSSITCTGFSTANYDIWPFPCQAIMMTVMFIGGMTGSTSGGIKTSRHLTVFRAFKRHIHNLFRPNLVQNLKIGNTTLEPSSVNSIFVFFWVIICVSAFGALLYVFDGLDLVTSAGLTACSVNNVGLTFRMAGPGSTCAFLPDFSKIVTIILMLLGRLEFFAILMIFTPSFWKSN